MFTNLRNHFGIPGLIAVAALVFAMIGGAYAANSSDGGGKATASAKGKKGPRGKRGPKGAPGAPGAQGPAGPAGPAGAKGDKGDAGANGAAGATGPAGPTGATGKDGQSVTNTSIATGLPQCDELGGAEFKVGPSGTPTFACNGEQGEKGEKGEKGEPWTPDNTLPDEATLTGTWSFNATDDNKGALAAPEAYVTLEFPIKLSEELTESKIHVEGEGASFTTNCTGSVEDPKALKGHLCIYKSFLEGATLEIVTDLGFSFTKKTNVHGALLYFTISGESAFGFGSWAVTGFPAA